MALVLKRMTDPYVCKRCSITRKIISYGEEYYEDDVDGTIIDFNYYYDTKFAQKVQDSMYKVDESMDIFAYKQTMLQKERQFLNKTMFDRPLADQNCLSQNDYYRSQILGEDSTYINKDMEAIAPYILNPEGDDSN